MSVYVCTRLDMVCTCVQGERTRGFMLTWCMRTHIAVAICVFGWGKSTDLFTHGVSFSCCLCLICKGGPSPGQGQKTWRGPQGPMFQHPPMFLSKVTLPSLVKSQAAQLTGVNQPEWPRLSGA